MHVRVCVCIFVGLFMYIHVHMYVYVTLADGGLSEQSDSQRWDGSENISVCFDSTVLPATEQERQRNASSPIKTTACLMHGKYHT